MSAMQSLGLLLGRLLLATIFVLSGLNKITNFSNTEAYMASKELPAVPVLLVLTIIIELGGGLMIALGLKARWAALAIFLFIIPVTLVFHPFWAVEPAQMQAQMINFLKNLAIMGGMLYVVVCGPGRFSLTRDG